MKYGQLSVGDLVYVYGKDGQIKHENISVTALNDEKGISTKTIRTGEGKHAAIMLNGLRDWSDFEYGEIITRHKLKLAAPAQKAPPAEEKVLPKAKTYNHADRNTHIKMATNDIACLCATGSLGSKREWIRNVGQDIYNAHGFGAMQEVFINVKNRYPAAQSQLSSIWDGVGGWAD